LLYFLLWYGRWFGAVIALLPRLFVVCSLLFVALLVIVPPGDASLYVVSRTQIVLFAAVAGCHHFLDHFLVLELIVLPCWSQS